MYISEGLIDWGAYFEIWLRRDGLVREGVLIEKGLSRAFMVCLIQPGNLTCFFCQTADLIKFFSLQ